MTRAIVVWLARRVMSDERRRFCRPQPGSARGSMRERVARASRSASRPRGRPAGQAELIGEITPPSGWPTGQPARPSPNGLRVEYGRFNFEGPIQAGDEIASTAAGSCTAAYGASDLVNEGKPNEAKRFFLLTAGHCFPIGAEVTQAGGNTIGTMKRNQLNPSEVPTVDAGAVLLDKTVSPPHHIFKSTQNQDPIEKPLTAFHTGQLVCQSGKRSGLKCGKVLNEGKPMLFIRRSASGARTQTWNIPIEVKVSRGDSGGPIFDRKTGRPVGITASAGSGSQDPDDPFYGIRSCRYFPEAGIEQYSCPIIGVQPLRSVANPGKGTAVGVLNALGLTFFHD